MAFNIFKFIMTDREFQILAVAPQGLQEDLGTMTDDFNSVLWYANHWTRLPPAARAQHVRDQKIN